MSNRYRYTAYDGSGKLVSGFVEGQDKSFVNRHLKQLDLNPISVSLYSNESDVQNEMTRNLRYTRPLNVPRFLDFADNLSLLCKSGFDIHAALIAMSRNGRGQNATLAAELASAISNGETFSNSLRISKTAFPDNFVFLMEAAEGNDQLQSAVTEYVRIEREKAKFISDLLGTFAYPGFVLVMAVLVVVTLSLTLAPSIVEIFRSEQVQPPFILSALTQVGDVISSKLFLNLMAFVLLIALLLMLFARKTTVRLVQQIKFKVPVIGVIFIDWEKSRMLNTLGLLIGHGVSVMDSFKQTSRTLEYRPLGSATTSIAQSLFEGDVLAETVSQHTILSGIIADGVSLANQSNSMSSTCQRLGGLFQEQAERQAKRISATLTPLLTLGVGIVIGLLIYATVAALLSINELVV